VRPPARIPVNRYTAETTRSQRLVFMMNIHQIKIFKFGGEITIHNQFGHVAPNQISTPFPNRESRTRFGHKVGRTWWPISRRARRRFATSARRDSVPSRLASNSAARASFAAVSGAACPNSISRQKGGEGYQRRSIRPFRVYRLLFQAPKINPSCCHARASERRSPRPNPLSNPLNQH